MLTKKTLDTIMETLVDCENDELDCEDCMFRAHMDECDIAEGKKWFRSLYRFIAADGDSDSTKLKESIEDIKDDMAMLHTRVVKLEDAAAHVSKVVSPLTLIGPPQSEVKWPTLNELDASNLGMENLGKNDKIT